LGGLCVVVGCVFFWLYQSFTPEEVKEIEKGLVQIDKLPTPEEFARYCLNEKDAKSKYDAFENVRENVIYHKTQIFAMYVKRLTTMPLRMDAKIERIL
jgi:hypothetical protein